MNYFHKLLVTLLLFLFSITIHSQVSYTHYKNQQTPGPSGHIRCSSMEVDLVRKLNNPALESPQQFEQWLGDKVKQYEIDQENQPEGLTTVLQIPVVVHVLHNGEALGTDPNITDAQVLSQITVLNQDYRKIINTNGYNTHPDGADLEIEFVMALTAPDGSGTNGVDRVNIGQDGATRDDLENTIKPNTIWDPTQYLNMWTVKFAAPDDNLLGYAQFPESSGLDGMPNSPQSAETDGVVQRASAFGSSEFDDGTFVLISPYDLGRTATHEVGHWLGLRHIWGDGLGCNLGTAPPACSCNDDDFCDDTPNSEKANYSCDADNISNCGIPPTASVDMDENYMDYTNDNCMNIFTNDQKARAQTVMANSPRRMELPNSPALLPPAPYITFVEESFEVEEGSSCLTKTVTTDLKIAQAPSADATVSFTLSGTAQNGTLLDYTISPSTVTFLAGQTANQTITITVYEDSEIEINEDVTITIDAVTTSGDAQAGFTNQTYALIIKDDDFDPDNAGIIANSLLFSEQFNSGLGAWTFSTSGASAVDWKVGTPVNGMIGNNNAYISRTDLPGNLYAYDYLTESWARLESPVINASDAVDLRLTFDYICFGEEDGDTQYDFGSLYYSIDGGTNWNRFGPILTGQLLETNLTVDLPSETDRASNLKIAFRWDNDALLGTDPPLSVDDIELRGSIGAPADVLTAINSQNKDERYFGPNSTVHFYDPETGDVMVTLVNNSAYDYGCTSVEVDRSTATAGASTVAFNNNDPENALAAKTFRIIPENNTPAPGETFDVTLFYTDSEVTNWETATGESRTSLEIIKVKDNPISVVNPSNSGSFIIENQIATLDIHNVNDVEVTATFASGFSGFGIGILGLNALPIELLDFYGEKVNQEVQLKWITANEINNDFFTIEKSNDGNSFQAIGMVAGTGNSNIQIAYDFMDKTPHSGINYYRLMQTDFDGTSTYSSIIAIEMDEKMEVDLFPNPAKDHVMISFGKNENDILPQIRIYNQVGKLINHNIENTNSNVARLDISGFPSGVYFVEIIINNAQITKRLIIN